MKTLLAPMSIFVDSGGAFIVPLVISSVVKI